MIFGIVPEWRPKEAAPAPVAVKSKSTHSSASRRRTVAAKPKAPVEPAIPADMAPRVRSLQISKDVWFAATNEGLFVSVDQGKKWYGQPVNGENSFSNVNSYPDGTVTLVSNRAAYISHDWGKTWDNVILPTYVGRLHDFTVMPDSSLWIASRQGAVQSTDGGRTWRYALGGLPKDDVLKVEYDPVGQRLLATALQQREVFVSKDNGQTWQPTQSADVLIRSAMNYQGRLLATSAFNGVLVQDEQGKSAQSSAKAAVIVETTRSE